MKKLLLAAAAACALSTAASAQTAANDNCKTIKSIMEVLETDNLDLKSYRGALVEQDSFKSNTTLTGFAQNYIVEESSVIMFLAKTAPIPTEEAAMATYKDLVKQINACIDTKRYPGSENKYTFKLAETVYSPRMEEGQAMVAVSIEKPFEKGDPYVVELMIVKNKPMK